MKKILKILGILILLALIVMQFFRPEKNNGGYESFVNFEKDTKLPDEVLSILKMNCFDCHTNQTRYPWYAEIAPISFWLDGHIKHGKGEFNMSKWDSYSLKKKDEKMEELIEKVKKGEMPLNSYTWIHGSLSEEDKELLLEWVSMVRLQYKDDLKVSSN